MPFGLLKKRRFKYRLVRAILVGLFCILLGLVSTFWQTASNLKRTTTLRMTHARQLVEGTLDSAKYASLAVKDNLGKPCLESVEFQLRMQVAYSQDVRSVNLAQGNKIYCSSLYGNNLENINVDNYTNGMLYLMSDTRVRKGQPLIIYRMVIGNDSIVVRLYGDHILSEPQCDEHQFTAGPGRRSTAVADICGSSVLIQHVGVSGAGLDPISFPDSDRYFPGELCPLLLDLLPVHAFRLAVTGRYCGFWRISLVRSIYHART